MKIAFYSTYTYNTGDIGGRCSDCRPGFKGDKGERGFDGLPGAIGIHSLKNTLWIPF